MKHSILICLLLGLSSLSLAETESNTENQTSSSFWDIPIPEEHYLGVYFGQWDIDQDFKNELDPRFDVFGGRIGLRPFEYLDTELRLARGLTSDTLIVDKARVSTELEYLLGGYLKLGIGQTFRPYALIGYNQVSMSASGANTEANALINDVGGGIATGLGIELKISNYGRRVTLTLECSDYYDKSGTQLAGCQFGAFGWF